MACFNQAHQFPGSVNIYASSLAMLNETLWNRTINVINCTSASPAVASKNVSCEKHLES